MNPDGTEEEAPQTLLARAALIPAGNGFTGEPSKGWYFAVLVRAAYSRLGGVA